MKLNIKKLALVLVLTFVLFSCDDENMGEETNPFVGTWESDDGGSRIVFSALTITNYKADGSIYWAGSYTYDDSYITIIIDTSSEDYSWGSPFIPWYKFEDDTLIMGGVSYKKSIQ